VDLHKSLPFGKIGEERSRVPGALKGLREVFPYARAGIEE